MKLILDAMSGDNAPLEIVKGAVMAAETLPSDVNILLVGKEDVVRDALAACGGTSYIGSRITLAAAEEVITMEDDPFDVLRKKKNSSMTVALRCLADGEGDALVCAGNTGALFTGATMIVRPVKGIRRAAIATVLPFDRPCLLLDCGANISVTAENMEQFAFMGVVYTEKLFGIQTPSVGLINNGTESHKGTAVYVETYERLSANKKLNFIGNVEGKNVPRGKCDVLVADGFTGNIILKMIEGMGSFFMKKMKTMLFANTATKLSALLLKGQLTKLKKDFDASEYGGSPFLGISKPVIKSHGSSDAKEIMNACRQAVSYVNTGITEEIARQAAVYVKTKSDT